MQRPGEGISGVGEQQMWSLEEGSHMTVQGLERKLLELDHVEPGEGGKSTVWRGARSWAL